MTGVAKGLFPHIRNVTHSTKKRAQAISIKCLQLSNSIKVYEPSALKRRDRNHLTIFHKTRGAGVFLNNVGWRKWRLVFPGPFTNNRQPAYQGLKACNLHMPIVISENNIGHARTHTTINYGDNIMFLGKLI